MKNKSVLYYFSTVAFIVLSSNAKIDLTDADINEIYMTFVKPNYSDEYKMRYVPLPLHKNKLAWRWEGKDLPRVLALLEFERFIVKHKIHCNKGLALNGLNPEWDYLPHKKVVQIEYEKDPEKYDLHKLDLLEKDFDFVMVNQTLEHVYDPIKCLERIYDHMVPGGILYLNVLAIIFPMELLFIIIQDLPLLGSELL